MKTWFPELLIVAIVAPAAFAQEATARRSGIGPAMLPADLKNPSVESISDEELLKRRNAASSQLLSGAPVAKEESAYSLLSLSCFLESNGAFAMLPKGCIIYCPKELEAKQVQRPGRSLTPWPEFLANNRNWIRCVEVSTAQIRGTEKFSDETLETWRKAGFLVIASLRGSPITVLKPNSPP